MNRESGNPLLDALGNRIEQILGGNFTVFVEEAADVEDFERSLVSSSNVVFVSYGGWMMADEYEGGRTKRLHNFSIFLKSKRAWEDCEELWKGLQEDPVIVINDGDAYSVSAPSCEPAKAFDTKIYTINCVLE